MPFGRGMVDEVTAHMGAERMEYDMRAKLNCTVQQPVIDTLHSAMITL